MNAIRTILKVNNNKITFTIPENFNESMVEVIILPLKQSSKKKNTTEKIYSKYNFQKNDIQKMLLAAPTMSDEDYNNFLIKQKHFIQWIPSV
jgi:hypothetical protein